MKEIAKYAGPKDCNTYYKMVVETCRETIHEGLDVSCSTLMMTARMAKKQKDGDLFKDPNGKVSAATIGNSLCAVNIKSLHRKIQKAKREEKKTWGALCSDFFNKLDEKCIAPIEKGEFGGSCTTVLSRINQIKKSEKSEDVCKMFGGLL